MANNPHNDRQDAQNPAVSSVTAGWPDQIDSRTSKIADTAPDSGGKQQDDEQNPQPATAGAKPTNYRAGGLTYEAPPG